MINSSGRGLRINLFCDSPTGQLTTGCTHLKMFAKPLDTPTIPLTISVIPSERSFCEDFTGTSLCISFIFSWSLKTLCPDTSLLLRSIRAPASLVMHLALVLKPRCPVSVLTLSYSTCQAVCLGWANIRVWASNPYISLFSCFISSIPSPALWLLRPQHGLFSLLIERKLLLQFTNWVGMLYRQSHKDKTNG